MKKIFLILLICITILTGCKDTKENSMQVVEDNGMLSYTINGEKTDSKPTKEEGYIVNKIICDNGTDMMWDNDNWEVELTKVESNDRCMVDFTKDVNTSGYRVTVTSNSTSSLDSLSKATTENGTIKIYSNSKIENVTGCNGIIDGNKVIISNVNSYQTCNIIIEDKTLATVIKKAYPPQSGRTNFNEIDNGEPSLYIDRDDHGNTYYFSGDGTNMNNWVKFDDKMWRIIRINGNGSIRLLYAGDGMNSNDFGNSFSGSSYNNLKNHPAYVGWKYTVGGSLTADRGNSTKSNAYVVVENWYNSISIDDKQFIDTNAIYCNDRNLGSKYSYNDILFEYVAYDRFFHSTNIKPKFTCDVINDRFYVFGLITADEVVYAGGAVRKTNKKAYYYLAKDGVNNITKGYGFWTMTPGDFRNSSATVFYVDRGGLDQNNLGVSASYLFVRPVISLKSNVVVTGGDGSGDNPYEVSLP